VPEKTLQAPLALSVMLIGHSIPIGERFGASQ
jgi:hypothetical protein